MLTFRTRLMFDTAAVGLSEMAVLSFLMQDGEGARPKKKKKLMKKKTKRKGKD